MKNTLKYLVSLTIAAAAACIGCSDWTETEALDFEKEPSAEYFAELRAFKATGHNHGRPIVFGWYSGWTGTGVDMNTSLVGIPDSMDLVSIWGNWSNLTRAQKKEMAEMRKRGTRLLVCFIVSDIGSGTTPQAVSEDWTVDGVQYASREEAMAAYWGWYDTKGDASPEGIEKAIRKYARSILDTVRKYDYDGFDFDYEPNYGYGGNLSSHSDRCHIFLSALAEELGPKSGTGKILMVDGEPQTLNAESGPLIDYYTVQAYTCGHYSDLDNRMNKLINKFGGLESKETIMSKTIWCENFEAYKSDGGVPHTLRDGGSTYSLMGMALYYRPDIDARIGGVGAYRFNLCRPVNDYIFMREVIQALNPAKGKTQDDPNA